MARISCTSLQTPLAGGITRTTWLVQLLAACGLGLPDAEFMKAMRRTGERATAGQAGCSGSKLGEETAFSVFVDYAHTHDALENVLTALRATMGVGSKGLVRAACF